MKVTLLIAQCTFQLLKQSIQVVTHVLREQLHTLPYFEGKR